MRPGHILAIGLVLIVLLLVARGLNENKIKIKLIQEYESKYAINNGKAMKECDKRGLQYIGVTSSNTIRFKAYCIQQSPFKVHEVVI